MKKALITGITGQDGSYLAEFLLDLGYEVHGIRRPSSAFSTQRIDHLIEDIHVVRQMRDPSNNLFLHYGDMSDGTSLSQLVYDIEPDEIYNLAAQSHVKLSWECPEYTADCVGLGTLRLLDAIRMNHLELETKFYQASTSELFGMAQGSVQNENTPFYPRSPYAAAKLYAYWICVNYRESFGLWAANGILFNHESPRRGETFVSRKITMAATRIKVGLQERLYLGNLNARRDWGHARDYVRGMWMIMQQEQPRDYVLATGISTSVREFCIMVFGELGIELEFRGSGVDEQGVDAATGRVLVEVDEQYFRPAEVDLLQGDSTRARTELGWEPEYDLKALIREMVASDLELAEREKIRRSQGHLHQSNDQSNEEQQNAAGSPAP